MELDDVRAETNDLIAEGEPEEGARTRPTASRRGRTLTSVHCPAVTPSDPEEERKGAIRTTAEVLRGARAGCHPQDLTRRTRASPASALRGPSRGRSRFTLRPLRQATKIAARAALHSTGPVAGATLEENCRSTSTGPFETRMASRWQNPDPESGSGWRRLDGRPDHARPIPRCYQRKSRGEHA